MATMYHILLLTLFFTFSSSLADDPSGHYCNQNTIITIGSPISTNINQLLAETVEKFEQGTNFIESSYGNGKNKVYGLAQCRGDVGSKDCLACINDAAQQVQKLCPNQADSRIWYDYCFLRYSQDQFYGNVDTSLGTLYANVENVTNPVIFNQELGKLYNKINSQAAKPKNGGLGKDMKKLSPFETLYGLSQCTRDLSPINCAQCLAIAIQNFEGFCSNKKGCRVLYSSCYVRYELYPFYFPLNQSKHDVVSKLNINTYT